MDGDLMSQLHGNLNQLSDKSLKSLVNYFATGILSSEEKSFLQNDLINEQDMLKEHYLQD